MEPQRTVYHKMYRCVRGGSDSDGSDRAGITKLMRRGMSRDRAGITKCDTGTYSDATVKNCQMYKIPTISGISVTVSSRRRFILYIYSSNSIFILNYP